MLQKMAMTRRFICWNHGMVQPLRWLNVTLTVGLGQRCHFSTEKHNTIAVPHLTQGRSSHLGGQVAQQPWMKTGHCQVRRFGEDVCAPRVAAQTDLGPAFADLSAWQMYHMHGDLSDEKQGPCEATTNHQNRKVSDNKPVRGRPGRTVRWTNLLTSQSGTWPSIAAAARELGVSPGKVTRSCRECSKIGDYKVEFAALPELLDCEKGLHVSKERTHGKGWMVSNHGRLRDSTGRLTQGTLSNSGYLRVGILGELFLVHRVVALMFHGPPPDPSAWQVHHRDGDPSNNRVENLTYVTSAQNTKNSYDNNPLRGNAGPAVSRPVVCKNVTTGQVLSCPSVSAAARNLGVSTWKVGESCRKGTRIGDFEVEFALATEPEVLEGEQWLPMLDPRTGLDAFGRQVSSHGRMKSAKGLVTKGYRTKSGYVTAKIGQRPSLRFIGVHRLVAYAFLGPPPSQQCSEVNHKDLDPGNNHVGNLEYVTASENQQHYQASRGSTPPNQSKAVLGRRSGTKDEWARYLSLTQAGTALGITPASISKCARGLKEQTRGYEFRFACSEEPADLPGEEWRPVDLEGLQREKANRKRKSKLGFNGKTST